MIGLPQPLYFDSNGATLFGWLRQGPNTGSSRIGLVICKAFGYEATCAHRAERAFAEAALAAGIPSLRFDYAGAGDSEGLDAGADQLEVWLQNVLDAVAELQRLTHVEHVCLLGIRLGSVLAALAARANRQITSLILVAPVIKGQRYLREMRNRRLFADVNQAGSDTAVAPRRGDPNGADGLLEVSGFPMSARTLVSLQAFDLTTLPGMSTCDVLFIDAAPAGGQPWLDELKRAGTRAEYVASTGLVGMIMKSPQSAVVPKDIVAAIHGWLAVRRARLLRDPEVAAVERDRSAADALPNEPDEPAMRISTGESGSVRVLTERPVFLNSRTRLFGIVTEPHAAENRRRAVILLNTGADYHIGSNGMSVTLARHWARHGYFVLRLDFGGIGDSGTEASEPDDVVFPAAALDDMRAAITYLRDRYGLGEVTLGGLCSGAYHALRAAAMGLPVNRILLINPQNYFWKSGDDVTDLQLADVQRFPDRFRAQLISYQAWKKMLAGGVKVWPLVRVYVHRWLLPVESSVRNLARRLHLRLPNDLGLELESIVRRRIKVVLVFARGEPGIWLLRQQAGSSLSRLGDAYRMHIVEGGDHIFSRSDAREQVTDILTRELFSTISNHGAASAPAMSRAR